MYLFIYLCLMYVFIYLFPQQNPNCSAWCLHPILSPPQTPLQPSATHLQVICRSYHSIEMYWKIDSDLPQNSALHCCSAQNFPGPTRLSRIPAAFFNSSRLNLDEKFCVQNGGADPTCIRTLKLIMKGLIWQTHIVLASCVLVKSTTSWFPEHCSKWICAKNVQD